MTHTIRVSRVLRETVNTQYSDLVTRATGAAVRTSIRATIASLPGIAVIDFSGSMRFGSTANYPPGNGNSNGAIIGLLNPDLHRSRISRN